MPEINHEIGRGIETEFRKKDHSTIKYFISKIGIPMNCTWALLHRQKNQVSKRLLNLIFSAVLHSNIIHVFKTIKPNCICFQKASINLTKILQKFTISDNS